MIKSITVTNYLGESIKMDLMSPEKSGFIVQKISGLGPGKADINTTEMAMSDGALYNSAKLKYRNIVLDLMFLPNPTIEDTRQLSYKFFPIKKELILEIETDNRILEATGYVEQNDPDVFSKSESTSISIICPDPYLYSKNVSNTVFSGVDPLFEFEFENNSLTEDLIEFGEIENRKEQTVYYSGDSDIGITIIIHSLGDVGDISIFKPDARQQMIIHADKIKALTGSGIIAKDDIVICTVKRKKEIYLLREGVKTNILNCIDRDSDWFEISKGDNIFIYTAASGSSQLQFRIENNIAYEGV